LKCQQNKLLGKQLEERIKVRCCEETNRGFWNRANKINKKKTKKKKTGDCHLLRRLVEKK